MMDKPKGIWRHEDKYLVSELELKLLYTRLHGLMRPDEHITFKGYYHISSLYFDDWENSMLWQNVNGVNNRVKYRIRLYENGLLFLEEKSKLNGLTHKESASISPETAYRLAHGGLLSFESAATPMMRRFALNERTAHLRPAVIVSYDRTALVCDTCNVRITFDRNITGSAYVESFMNYPPSIPALEVGWHVLEVKYDAFLPEHIEKMLHTGKMQVTAFSKYTMSRNIMLMPRRKELIT